MGSNNKGFSMEAMDIGRRGDAQLAVQMLDHEMTLALHQSIWGLCFFSQGRSNTNQGVFKART